MKRVPWGPILAALGGGGAVAVGVYLWRKDSSMPEDKPEPALEGPRAEPVSPSTGRARVDALLPKLRQIASNSGIPLGLLVGWIAKESAGRIATKPQPGPGDTKLDERGYFQLHPDESKALGLDHARLSVDLDYSLEAGVKLVQKYMQRANALNVAKTGTSYFWRLVKLLHTMGSGATKKIVEAAKKTGAASSWAALRGYAIDNDQKLLSLTKHSPKKWFPLVDAVYQIGQPFGFGEDPEASPLLVGAAGDEDVSALARALERARGARSVEEQQAVAWVVRNRARGAGVPIAEIAPPGSATAWSRKVAAAVLAQPASADPTGGATDYWIPSAQATERALGDLHRQAVLGGDVVRAAELVAFADAPSEIEARRKIAEAGLRILGRAGDLELLG